MQGATFHFHPLSQPWLGQRFGVMRRLTDVHNRIVVKSQKQLEFGRKEGR